MPSSEKQVRVFISSTFRDMHAERDHLVTVVFPELRERVEQLGLEFFDVDLRWGVPEKTVNGETANSWEYCRQWIDRVEPFFVCILGQRYGWVPKVTDFKDGADQARQAAEPRSITDLEVRHAVLNDRRKRRSYFYLRETPVPQLPPGATVEQRQIHGEFVDPPELLQQLDALKAEVRGSGRPVRDYDCRWAGNEFTDIDKAEKKFGPMVLEDLWSGVLRDERYVSKEVWRQVLGTDPDIDRRYTDEFKPVPRVLWERIVALARPAPVSPLDADRQQMDAFAASRLRWFQGRTRELQQLTGFLNDTAAEAPRIAIVAAVPGQGKSALIAKLCREIAPNELPLALPSDPLAPSDGERAGVRGCFVITHFVGATERSASANALVERLLGELDRSGITWPTEEQKEGEEPKRDFNSLCLRLAQWLGDYAGERRIVILLDALNQLSDGHDLQWLPHRLGPSVRVIVSCIDAVADPSPSPSPPKGERAGVRGPSEPVSPEQRVLYSLASRQPAPLRVPLNPLTEADVRTIVVAYLKEYCKELDRTHVATLCALPQARNPLYLLVMLGELRTLGGNDMNLIVPALITSLPQDHPDTVSLFRWVLQRLEVFNKDAPDAVRWWCLYLAHGRVGMASKELADLLARKLGSDAAAIALRIERGLRRYLQRRGPQLDYFHGQLRQAVFEQYGPQGEVVAVHEDIATYFRALADPNHDRAWLAYSTRGLCELLYHLTFAERTDDVVALLEDFLFLEVRAATGRRVSWMLKVEQVYYRGYYDLVEDIQRFLCSLPQQYTASIPGHIETISHLLFLLTQKAGVLAQYPQLIFQCCFNQEESESLHTLASVWIAANGNRYHSWMRKLNRIAIPTDPTQGVRLIGHRKGITGCCFTYDSRRIISAAEDDLVRIWDVFTGAPTGTVDLGKKVTFLRDDQRITQYARPWISDIAVTRNSVGLLCRYGLYILYPSTMATSWHELDRSGGANSLVASEDKYFIAVDRFVWITDEQGNTIRRLLEHKRRRTIKALAVSQNGSHLVSVDYAGLLIVNRINGDSWVVHQEYALQYEQYGNWQFHLRRLEQWDSAKQNYQSASLGLSISNDGRLLVVRNMGQSTFQVFDLENNESICHVENRRYNMWFASLSIDGCNVAYSADWQGRFRNVGLVSLNSGETRYFVLAHADWCTYGEFSKSGDSLVVGSMDRTLSILPLSAAVSSDTLDRLPCIHEDEINGCVLSVEEKLVAVWSVDQVVSVWDIDSGCLVFKTPSLGNTGNTSIRAVGFDPTEDYIVIFQGYNRQKRFTLWRLSDASLIFDTNQHLSRNRDPFDDFVEYGCVFDFGSKRIAVAVTRMIYVVSLTSGKILAKLKKPDHVVYGNLHFTAEGDLVLPCRTDAEGGAMHCEGYIWKEGTRAFIGCLGLDKPVFEWGEAAQKGNLGNSGAWRYCSGLFPNENLGNVSVERYLGIGCVDDDLPGQEFLVVLRKSGEPLGLFQAEGRVTCVGLTPRKGHVLVGDTAGGFAILKYEATTQPPITKPIRLTEGVCE